MNQIPRNFAAFPTYSYPAPSQNYGSPVQQGHGYQAFALQQMLGQLLQVFTLMAQGWQGMAGGIQPYSQPSAGAQAYGGSGQPGGQSLSLPSDPQDFASYLQAQRIGGSLQGRTTLAQKDAIPGTRFGRPADSHSWDVAVARNYAFQFAAYASDNDALSAQGVQAGARAFQNMSPDAKLFMQVASVFKGDINGGPGFYDNPELKQLLESRGQFDLTSKPGVGETDVQTIGAITKAINRGVLSLNDIVNSGTIDNLPRYQEIIR